MKILLSHPTGNANVKSLTKAMRKEDILFEYHTTLAQFNNYLFFDISKSKFLRKINKRSYDNALKNYIKLHPYFELGRLISRKIGIKSLSKHERGIFSIDSVYKNLDRDVAKRIKFLNLVVDAVYCYEDGAYNTFVEAKRQGIKCFYELPTGYWRSAKKLLKIENEIWPQYSNTISGFKDSEAKLKLKDTELLLSDKIFVASSFVAHTLSDFPGLLSEIKVIPYGFPPIYKNRIYNKLTKSRPLKLLFVGRLSQQKGIANLFEAIEPLRKFVNLTLVGQKVSDNCPILDSQLKKHKWIPSLNHIDLLNLMKDNDILVFPTLFDGYGLVISEAMSQGTAVITTERSAGPDLIKNNENGIIVKAGSSIQIKEAIETILFNNKLIIDLGQNAIKTAQQRPWEKYELEILKAISSN